MSKILSLLTSARPWRRALAPALLTFLLLPASGRADVPFHDDVLVFGAPGGLCVGQDCFDGIDFELNSVILRENNNRILFDDTSLTATYPSNHWQLRANSALDGGDNFLGIVDQGPRGSFPRFCEGGDNHGSVCTENGNECRGVCENGVFDGLPCSQDANCTGGTCNAAPGLCQEAGNVVLRVRAGAPEDSLVMEPSGDVVMPGLVNGRDMVADGIKLDSLGGGGAGLQAGSVPHADFASSGGSAREASVVLSTPIAGPYVVLLTPTASRPITGVPVVSDQTPNGFKILLKSSGLRRLDTMSWVAIPLS